MSGLPTAALTLVAAAFLSALAAGSGRFTYRLAARALAVIGAALTLPALGAPAAWPAAAAALVAALLPRPLALLLASAGAVAYSLRPPGAGPWPIALSVLAMAAVAAGAGLSSTAERVDARRTAAGAGLLLAVTLAAADAGHVLRWSYLGLPGAGLLLGLALLASAGGALLVAAEVLASGSALARVTGRRLLLLAVGFAILGAAFALLSAADASSLVVLLAATGTLVVALVFLLQGPAAGDARFVLERADMETRIASVLAVLGVAATGYEAWLRQASYATPATAAATAAGLAGLAAVEPTRFALARRLLLLCALIYALGTPPG
jgi:hypothetical protein